MEDEDFRQRERYKQRLRQEDRDDADKRRREQQRDKKGDGELEALKRQRLDRERQQLRASINNREHDRRNNIKRAEKEEEQQLKNQGEIYKSDIQRVNHADSLKHSADISKQEHGQQLKQDTQWQQHEITLRQGELRAEQAFIQERQKGDLALAEAEQRRAEMLAEYDLQQALSTQQEITTKEITIAREQTEREVELAKENNNQALVLEKLKHLSLLDQKSKDLADYEGRVIADGKALKLKEDDALDRRLAESRHNFGQDMQKLHAEFLRMKLENDLKKDYFTHEQETLLRLRKLARDLGLGSVNMNAEELTDMLMEFDAIDRQG